MKNTCLRTLANLTFIWSLVKISLFLAKSRNFLNVPSTSWHPREGTARSLQCIWGCRISNLLEVSSLSIRNIDGVYHRFRVDYFYITGEIFLLNIQRGTSGCLLFEYIFQPIRQTEGGEVLFLWSDCSSWGTRCLTMTLSVTVDIS